MLPLLIVDTTIAPHPHFIKYFITKRMLQTDLRRVKKKRNIELIHNI